MVIHRICLIVVAITLTVGWTATTAVSAPQYRIVALEPLPGGVDTIATAINELGVVVGYSTLDRSGNVGRSRPVIWDSSGWPTELWEHRDGYMCDFQTMTCLEPTPGAIPLGINSSGQVVGRYGFGSGVPLPELGVPPGRAFIWDAVNGLHDLGSLGGNRIEAVAINEHGQVAGTSSTGQTSDEGIVDEAFIWDAVNGMQGIGTLGGVVSRAAAINNLGQVAGTSWLADYSEGPFLWDSVDGMRELASPSGDEARALGMNDASYVIGFDWDTSGFVVWGSDDYLIVPVPSGVSLRPFDINNRGEMVGYVGVLGEARLEAFLWSESTGILRLNSLLLPNSGWNLTSATAINDRGQIVGRGWLNDQIRGFLMTPVPEPSGLVFALMAICTAIFARVRRRAISLELWES